MTELTTIKSFRDGSRLAYGHGNFDDYCVFLVDKNGKRSVPRDVEYFSVLRKLSQIVSAEKLYQDFVMLYNATGERVDANVLRNITNVAGSYGDLQDVIDVVWSILYLGMVAEENKEHTILGKRIKRLGVYYVLVENQPIDFAANFMRGKNWRDLDKICKERGF